jgi:hypothetical protein
LPHRNPPTREQFPVQIPVQCHSISKKLNKELFKRCSFSIN